MPALDRIWALHRAGAPVPVWVGTASNSPLDDAVFAEGEVPRNLRGQANVPRTRSTIRMRWRPDVDWEFDYFKDPDGLTWVVDRYQTIGRRQYLDLDVSGYQGLELSVDPSNPGGLVPAPDPDWLPPLGYNLTRAGVPVQSLRVTKADLAVSSYPHLYLGSVDEESNLPFIEVDVEGLVGSVVHRPPFSVDIITDRRIEWVVGADVGDLTRSFARRIPARVQGVNVWIEFVDFHFVTGFGPGVERLPFMEPEDENDPTVHAFDNTFTDYTTESEFEIAKWAEAVTLTAGQTRQSIALYQLPGTLGDENPAAWFGFDGRAQFFDVQVGGLHPDFGSVNAEVERQRDRPGRSNRTAGPGQHRSGAQASVSGNRQTGVEGVAFIDATSNREAAQSAVCATAAGWLVVSGTR